MGILGRDYEVLGSVWATTKFGTKLFQTIWVNWGVWFMEDFCYSGYVWRPICVCKSNYAEVMAIKVALEDFYQSKQVVKNALMVEFNHCKLDFESLKVAMEMVKNLSIGGRTKATDRVCLIYKHL